VRKPLDDDEEGDEDEVEEQWMRRSGRTIPGERKEPSPFVDEEAEEDSGEDSEGLIEIGSRRRTS
ncbi:MAG: hypothetical protein Q9157_004534, partial [Trypethelium eluteriae]